MSAREFSSHQRKIVKNYYENLDLIMLSRLSELVTELYLADTNAKRNRLWDRVAKAMKKLKIPPVVMNNILKRRSVEILAKSVNDWLKQ